MKRPSLNHSYRLVWKEILGAYVAVPECARGRGKAGKRLIMATLLTPALSLAAPTGGTVTSGNASISQTGTVTQINQSTQKASINWQGFSIGSNETVNFNQPGSSAVTLNRVVGNEKSVIDGTLNANGQVFLINSNGMLFSKGSTVNVGGLVASTLNLSDEDFNAGNYVFKANGSTGAVLNLGTITAKDGGYVTLLGNDVSNQGLITATKGTVALSAGDKITLNFNGDSLLSVTLDEGTLNALVENKQAIHADGGTVILTAKAADELLGAQVNNSGIVQARTVDDLKGKIELYAHGGTANVDGTLDASAPTGGDGGFIETSGDKVKVAETASISTKAAGGKTGSWLIDPTDFTIGLGGGAQTSSDIGVDTLAAQLANTAVSIATSTSGTGKGDIHVNAGLGIGTNKVTTNGLPNALTLTAFGDIYINAPIYWNANTLTLNAGKNIFVDAISTYSTSPAMVGSGTAGLVATYGTGSNTDGTPMGLYTVSRGYASQTMINFSGTGGVALNGTPYTVITDVAGLNAINNNLSGNYVLGSDIYAGSLVGNLGTFSGKFNGFGHTINASLQGTGLFETIGTGGLVCNLIASTNVNQPATISSSSVGGLANENRGTIVNTASAGSVNYTAPAALSGVDTVYAGGIVGINHGLIAQSLSNASVNASYVAGGLVGLNDASGVIRDSFSANNVTSNATVTSVGYAGGLVGINAGRIQTSYSNGSPLIDASSTNAKVGGLVGWNKAGGVIDQSYVSVSGWNTASNYTDKVAGFVWANDGTITNAYSTMLNNQNGAGNYLSNRWTAGFVNSNTGSIDGAYTMVHSGANATSQSTSGSVLCGFACSNTGSIQHAYWSATTDAATATTTPVAPTDATTATRLTSAQAATYASYAGFDQNAWSASLSGYPVLGNIPIYVFSGGGLGSSGVAYYGDASADAATLGGTSGLSVVGLQGGGGLSSLVDSLVNGVYDPVTNTVRNLFTVETDASGYVNAGSYSAASLLSSSAYKNFKGNITVNPLPLQLSSDLVVDKTYDGTTVGSINTSLANNGLIGLVGSQTLDVNWSALDAVAFNTANAGTKKTVTLVYSKLSDLLKDGANGGKAANYTLVGDINGAGTSGTKMAITYINGTAYYWNTATQAYDLPQTTSVNGSYMYFNPVTGAYDRTSRYSGALNTWYWDQGTGKFDIPIILVDGSTTTYYNPQTNSYQASAYTGTTRYFQAVTTGDITPKSLSASFTGDNKVYDGTTTASVSGGVLSGVVGSDAVSLDTSHLSANFADANVGSNKAVTVADLGLTGAAAGNYVIGSQTTTASVTPLVLQLGGLKPADGSASVAGSSLIAVNLVAGDALTIAGNATLTSAAAGNQAIGSLGGLSLNNPNYTLNGATGTVTVGGGNQVVGRIYDSAATVSTSGKTTTVNQSADKAIIDWLRFSIAAGETVNFVQPSASAIVLNRVVGNEQSVITGALNANGRVFILNSNGVLFKASSSVNVGALVASTSSISNSDFNHGNYVFVAKSGTGSVIAEGDIVIADGGFVALASGNGVSNSGGIYAAHGKAVMASADKLALDLASSGAGLSDYNIENLRGKTSVGGVINVTDGLLETAGTTVSPASDFMLGTGNNGIWSYSLPSITIGGSDSNVAASFVKNNLGLRNFTVNALGGDLTVNDGLTWSTNTVLGLGAKNDIHIKNAIKASGDHAGLSMAYGGDYDIRTKASYAGVAFDANGKPVAQEDTSGGIYGSVTLSGANASLKINGQHYTLIHSIDQLDALDQGNSQTGMYYNLKTGNYDTSITALKAGTVSGLKNIKSGTNYYNETTKAYDIPLSQVVNGTTMYYNPLTKAYDLTAAYSGNTNRNYNPVTAQYDIPSLDPSGSGKYWNPVTHAYDLASRNSASMVYNATTNRYDMAQTDPVSGKYYDPMTGGYTSTSYINVNSFYFNPSTGRNDLIVPYAATGHYALASDLDASGKSYVTSPLEAFTGTLAGLGHSIDNLTVNSPNGSPNGIGLIGTTGTGSTVRDLGLQNVNIQAKPANNANGQVGSGAALVGVANGTGFSGDYVTGSLNFSGSGMTGGLVGWSMGGSTFENVFADITATNITAGLVGRTQNGSLVNTHVSGSLTGAQGGLIGTSYSTRLSNSYFMGSNAKQGLKIVKDANGNLLNADILSSSDLMAGLVGQYNFSGGANGIYNSFSISNLASSGAVPVIGGLIGTMGLDTNSPFTLDNSYWRGDINATSINVGEGYVIYVTIGGLIGANAGPVSGPGNGATTTISNSYVKGSIEADGTGGGIVGGMVGQLKHQSSGAGASSPDVISDSQSDINISAATMSTVGGLVGNGSVISIQRSQVSGNIIGGNGSTGGLVGNVSSFQYSDPSLGRWQVPWSAIGDSYFNGTISGSGSVGALAGSGLYLKFDNDYWNAGAGAGGVGRGLSSADQWSSENKALSGETFASGDVKYYTNGTINQVIAARQAAATRQQVFRDAGAKVATSEVAQVQAPAESPQKKLRADSTVSLADALDQNIVFVDKRNYAADVRRIEVDGQVFILEEDEEEHPPVVPKR